MLLKNKRKELGIKQSEICKLIGVNRNTIVSWETKLKYPTLDKMQKIIDCYKLSNLEVMQLIKEYAKEI